MKSNWINSHTFHHSAFANIKKLVEAKEKKNLKISLCLPTLNEENTIAKEIIIIKSELMTKYPLLDELIVIDSGSTDKTVKIAQDYGADVFPASEILPDLKEQYRGKGENLWKALYVTTGDIIVYLDADIKNIHHRFAYGLIGPLLLNDDIKYVKAFYDRPISIASQKIRPSGGGRVTELVIRPLFSLIYPDLSQIIQPLSGEYAGYREIFEKVAFPIGYGVETSMLIDIYEQWGLDIIGQVDLDRRVHRNQDTLALGRMSFGILQTFFKRLSKKNTDKILNDALFNTMVQFQITEGKYKPSFYEIKEQERPPIINLKEYKTKFYPDEK